MPGYERGWIGISLFIRVLSLGVGGVAACQDQVRLVLRMTEKAHTVELRGVVD